MEQKITDNHKENNKAGASISAKLRSFIAGLTPASIFKYTLATSVIIALAATIIYYTATDSKHVNIDKVETASILLSGADDIGGISAGGFASLNYVVKNDSTSPAYVFIRIEMATQGLYEVVDTSGWVEVTAAESENELIFAYGESAGAMEPVGIGEEVVMSGRLHCLADAVMYSGLSGDDLDIDVEGCLVFGTAEDGSGGVAYNTSALALWQAYQDNKD